MGVQQLFFKGFKVLRRVSPTLGVVGGAAGLVVAGVLAYRKHDEAEQVVEDVLGSVEFIKEREYEPRIERREICNAYIHGGLDMLRVFSWPLVIGGLSLVAIGTGHVTILKRLGTVTASYAALNSDYLALQEEYRGYLREHGDDETLHGYSRSMETVPGVDPETGKKTKEKVERVTAGTRKPVGASRYAVLFGDHLPQWSDAIGMNRVYLMNVQKYWNQELKNRTKAIGIPGKVTWSEILHHMGMESEAAVARNNLDGWIDDGSESPIILGFDYVGDPLCEAFMADREQTVWLDPNVQGPIWSLV